MRSLNDALSKVEASLFPILERKREEVVSELTRTEHASLNVSLAFAATSLFHTLLKTKGMPMANHPVKAELERVKLYMKRVREKQKAQGEEAVFKPDPKPTLRVDKEASSRIVAAALNSDLVRPLGINHNCAGKGKAQER